MANEKKTIKTKLVQVGTEKIDMPYTLDQFVITTDGKTVKEQVDNINNEIGKPKEYVISTDTDALEVVENSTTPSNVQIKLSDANQYGGTFVAGDKVKLVDSTGIYKVIDDSINGDKIEFVRDNIGSDGISF